MYTQVKQASSNTSSVITLEHRIKFISFHRMYVYICKTNTPGKLKLQIHITNLSITFAFCSVGILLPSSLRFKIALLRP
jgi:hypothetical protein